MGIPSNYLPDDSPSIQHAYDHSLQTVNMDLIVVWGPQGSNQTSWSQYELAVYNLAGHILIEFAQDQVYPLASLSFSGGVVSGATSTASGLLPGNQVKIVNVSPLAYAGPPNLGYVVVQATPTTSSFQYNLASNPGTATLLAGAAVQQTLFATARQKFRLGQFFPGMVSTSSDVSTSVGLENPDFMRGLTIENLQLMSTPFGRAYMAIAQKAGPAVWGVS